MRADRQGAKTPHILDQMPWLVAIGQQLREEYVAEPSLPEDLATRLERLEGGEAQYEPAAVRLAIINAVVRTSIARRSPTSVSCAHEEWSDAHTAELAMPSRQATTLGEFEKSVLDLFDNHLSEPDRSSAVRKFVSYMKVCHAMLDLGLIKEREIAL